MDFSRATQSASDLLGGIKDRFSRNGKGDDAQALSGADAAYDDYEMGYEDGDASIEGDYGPYSYGEPVGGEYADGYGDYSYAGRGVRMPALVTSEDVRATTSVRGVDVNRWRVAATNAAVADEYLGHAGRGVRPNEGNRPAYSEYGDYDEYAEYAGDLLEQEEPSGQSSSVVKGPGSEYVPDYADFVSPYRSGHSGAVSSRPARSSRDAAASAGSASAASSMPSTSSASGRVPEREMAIIAPAAYQDVQDVAALVRQGKLVALNLRLTDPQLSRRVLDFSFGVASALDAHVECVANDVFVLALGGRISYEERMQLQRQGLR